VQARTGRHYSITPKLKLLVTIFSIDFLQYSFYNNFMDKICEQDKREFSSSQKRAQSVQSINDAPYLNVNESPTQEQMLKIVKNMAVRLHLDPNHVHNHLYLKERFCPNPFKNVTTAISSYDRKTQELKLKAYVCCVGFLPVPIKEDISDNDNWGNFWNSERAMEIRRSILDGDFSYCLENCTELKRNSLPLKHKIRNPYFRDIIDNHKTKLERGPLQISFGHDGSCNLACGSCRSTLKIASKELNELYDLLLENMIKPWLNSDLDYPRTVLVGDNGDPFFSKHYRDILGVFDP
jgi:hypothetical protein